MEELGKLVRSQLERDMSVTSPSLQSPMLRCLDQVENAVEALCPAALAVGPRGTGTAYGPMGIPNKGHVIIFATPKTYHIMQVERWGRQTGPLPVFPAGAVWSAIADVIEQGDLSSAVNMLCYRCGVEHLKTMDKESARIRRSGLTPIVVVLVATSKDKIIGAARVCALPASLETQIERIER